MRPSERNPDRRPDFIPPSLPTTALNKTGILIYWARGEGKTSHLSRLGNGEPRTGQLRGQL